MNYTGGPALRELQQVFGATRVTLLYGHVDPETHKPVPAVQHYTSHFSYLETYAEDQQPALERLFVESARRLPQSKFVIGGAQYPAEFPWTANIFFVQHLPPAEHPAFFCSSRLTLNITCAAMAEMGWSHSGRLFVAAACGVPVVSDSWPGLDEFFVPGREILIANDTRDVVATANPCRPRRRRSITIAFKASRCSPSKWLGNSELPSCTGLPALRGPSQRHSAQ